MSREARTLSVPEGVAGERIDSALTRVLGLSRTAIVRLLEDGDITTGGRAMTKSERVTDGQIIDVLMPEPLNQDPIPLTPLAGLTVVYDDEDIVVIDKPVGCAAHPSPGWMGPTVVGALTAAGYTISTSGPAERAGIVHRLDVGTSGLMIVAKTDRAYTKLKDAFRNHEVEKLITHLCKDIWIQSPEQLMRRLIATLKRIIALQLLQPAKRVLRTMK
jgi:23S rRNA pseudouridine1911/1915/1917 synthase